MRIEIVVALPKKRSQKGLTSSFAKQRQKKQDKKKKKNEASVKLVNKTRTLSFCYGRDMLGVKLYLCVCVLTLSTAVTRSHHEIDDDASSTKRKDT